MTYQKLKNNFNINFLLLIFVSFLPITLIMGSAITNASIILIDLIFLYVLYKNKEFKFLNSQTFYLLLCLWIMLLINMILSSNIENSLTRSLGFFRFILLVFGIKYLLIKNAKYQNLVFSFWTILFLIISFDILFEYFFGFNTLGFKNIIPGRISSFLDQELKIGNYYIGFILISSSFLYYKFKNYYLLFCLLLIFTVIALITGERSNFIKCFIMIFIFFIYFEDIGLKKKITGFLLVLLVAGVVVSSNYNLKDRFIVQTFKTVSNVNYNPVTYLRYSTYGAHYNAALKIFKNYPIFGVGLKNYRVESGKDEYINSEYIFTDQRRTTHPHQIHFELLSETGLIGYLSFIICFFLFLRSSIKKFINKKNIYQLSGILFVTCSFLPFIPGGSFFTTFGATIFWINFALIETFND